MTVNEILKNYKGEYADFEIFVPLSGGNNYPHAFHTDNCEAVRIDNGVCYIGFNDEDYIDFSKLQNLEAGLVELMGEEEYYNSIYANASNPKEPFAELYDDKEAKILCIMLKADPRWFQRS